MEPRKNRVMTFSQALRYISFFSHIRIESVLKDISLEVLEETWPF